MKRRIPNGKNDQNGFAVVYGLAILFAATIAGTSLTYITNKDKVASTEMVKVRAAAIAARASLQAVEGQFAKQPAVAYNIIKKYTTNPSYKWLLGNDPNSANNPVSVQLKPDNPNSPSFSARIMRFDPTSALLQVEGIGKGGGFSGGKKSVVAIYSIGGVEQKTSHKKRHALYIAGEGKNFDTRITINGDVYFGGDVMFNGGANNSLINGNLKVGVTSNPTAQFRSDANLTVKGNAYIQTNFFSQAGLTVEGKMGFEKDVEIRNNQMQLHGDAYFNGRIPNDCWNINMNNHKATYTNRIENSSKIINASARENIGGGRIDIASRLGMEAGDETAFRVDISSIDESYIQPVGSIIPDKITSSSLQWAYDHTPADKKWNDFMVVRVNSEKAIQDDGGTFNGKVIWIVESKIICNQSLFKSSANSNSLFYVKSGGEITELGGVNDFRGYVHVEGTGTVTQAWKGGTFNGAIHYASENANFQFNSGCHLTMNYDTDAIQEFIDMGIVDPRQDLVEKELVLQDTRIRPILQGVYY